jgi:hypothetical protein
MSLNCAPVESFGFWPISPIDLTVGKKSTPSGHQFEAYNMAIYGDALIANVPHVKGGRFVCKLYAVSGQRSVLFFPENNGNGFVGKPAYAISRDKAEAERLVALWKGQNPNWQTL